MDYVQPVIGSHESQSCRDYPQLRPWSPPKHQIGSTWLNITTSHSTWITYLPDTHHNFVCNMIAGRARSDLATGLDIIVHSTVNLSNGCREHRQRGGSQRRGDGDFGQWGAHAELKEDAPSSTFRVTTHYYEYRKEYLDLFFMTGTCPNQPFRFQTHRTSGRTHIRCPANLKIRIQQA